MTRTIITGGSRTGKTTLALTLDGPVYHTDSLAHLPWSSQSDEVVRWLARPGAWTIDGCAATRALRKYLLDNDLRPCDRIIRLTSPVVARTPGQETLSKGERKIWAEIAPELVRRGVLIEYR